MKWTDQSPDDSMPLGSAAETGTSTRCLCQARGNCQVLIGPAVHAQVLAHLRSQVVEQGGLLIGIPYRNAQGQASTIRVVDAVAAPDASATGFSLRMEAAVWSAANARLADLRADTGLSDKQHLRIVGWYHSHPGLGAFFSSTDRSTQAAFFHHPYSVGWVIDPSDDSHAGFLGRSSEPVSCFLNVWDGTTER